MDGTEVREPWDAGYRQKGRLYGGGPRRLPDFPGGSRVLEIGCGDGKTLSALICRGWEVTAIDFSPRAVQLAMAIARQDFSAAVAIADAGTLPFRTASFDAVTAVHVLGHSPTAGRARIAREIARVIRPGGEVSFRDFSIRDFRCGRGREEEPGTFVRDGGILTHYFTEDEVSSLFPGFTRESLSFDEWTLRVRGREYPRSEIAAMFRRPAPRD